MFILTDKLDRKNNNKHTLNHIFMVEYCQSIAHVGDLIH